MIVEFTRSFDRNFSKLPIALQKEAKGVVGEFLDCYTHRQFPKSLRMHKCGPFVSLSVSMSYRIFVSPTAGGVKFVFVGDHKDADDYLKKNCLFAN